VVVLSFGEHASSRKITNCFPDRIKPDAFAVKQNKHRVVAHSRLSAARLNTATSLQGHFPDAVFEKADQSTEG
jgi:hypothetical protein